MFHFFMTVLGFFIAWFWLAILWAVIRATFDSIKGAITVPAITVPAVPASLKKANSAINRFFGIKEN